MFLAILSFHQTPQSVSKLKDRSQSVPVAPNVTTPRQSLLPFGGGHFGPLNGLRQLVSPHSHEEEVFTIPLEEVLEELEAAGVVGEEGYSTERVLQVGGAGFGGGCSTSGRGSGLDQHAQVLPIPISPPLGIGLGVGKLCQFAEFGLQHGPVPHDPHSRQGPSRLCHETDSHQSLSE